MTDIGDRIDATMAALDGIFQADRDRKAADHAQLQAVVAGLDYGTPLEPGEEERPLRREPEPAAPVVVAPLDYNPRGTGDRPGGPYLARLTAESFRRSRW